MTHKPVLLKEVIEGLNLREGLVVLDGTINRAGHSVKIAELIGKEGTLIGFDKDGEAISEARGNLDFFKGKLILENRGYEDLDLVLKDHGISKVDRVLFDLGLSSNQLDDSGRGFTFSKDEPLLMTFGSNPTADDVTAESILNHWDEATLADVIYGFGGERYARRIARQIVESRESEPIKRTTDLVEIISRAVPALYKRRKIHFATKTFQAIRMAVNSEFNVIKIGLEKAFKSLTKGGELLVISFHEVEDRIVKNFMKEIEARELGKRINKKPITPSTEEIDHNPRSRSAKLRILEKINENKSSNNFKLPE